MTIFSEFWSRAFRAARNGEDLDQYDQEVGLRGSPEAGPYSILCCLETVTEVLLNGRTVAD